jgi:hypothetical protein
VQLPKIRALDEQVRAVMAQPVATSAAAVDDAHAPKPSLMSRVSQKSAATLRKLLGARMPEQTPSGKQWSAKLRGWDSAKLQAAYDVSGSAAPAEGVPAAAGAPSDKRGLDPALSKLRRLTLRTGMIPMASSASSAY